MKIKFNKKIEELSMEMLTHSGVHRDYTDEDLSNTVVIFSEVLLSKMHDKHYTQLGQKGMEKLAKEVGESLHQTLKLFAGVDLHKIYK